MLRNRDRMIIRKNRFVQGLCALTAAMTIFAGGIWNNALVAKAAETIAASSGPSVEAESAILMDADSGAVLYAKNIHQQMYPASITKLLTCLVARENAELDETVTFSQEAVFGIELGSSNIGMDVGETLTMEQCLYAIMLASANEVASAVAEHVGGTVDEFTAMMNDRAKELGCTNSNFVNANGLPDNNHYTSAYDMALIARAFFADDALTKISGTATYHIPISPTQPDDIDIVNHHKMLSDCVSSSKYRYEYTVGGKTGYTVAAGNTLVTCAQKDGMRLICVVLKDANKAHYTDTKSLFEYGFENFKKVSGLEVLTTEETQTLVHTALGEGACEITEPAKIILPDTASCDQVQTAVTEGENGEVTVSYTYQGQQVGEMPVNFVKTVVDEHLSEDVDEQQSDAEQGQEKGAQSVVLSVLKTVFIVIGILAVAAAILGFVLYKRHLEEQERLRKRQEIMDRHRKRKEENGNPGEE